MNVRKNKANFSTDKMPKKFLMQLAYFSRYLKKLKVENAKNGQICLRNLVLGISTLWA